MPTMMIDGLAIPFHDEANVLAVIRKAGIDLPTLCYVSELSIYGACRLCTVKDDQGRYFASCSAMPQEGMVIFTNTPELRKYRRMLVELLLASHDQNCPTCPKCGRCHLQNLAERMSVRTIRFSPLREHHAKDTSSNSLIRNPAKCILCGDCVRMCDNVQSVDALDFAGKGAQTFVSPAYNKLLAESDCVGCGQCRVVCPTGAITVKDSTQAVWDALDDPQCRVVVQIAPAVRAAVGEDFGSPAGTNVMNQLVTALRRLGFDAVYDTAFGADLTTAEESQEFLQRLESGKNLPLFTSCCPGWVNFCEKRHPDFLPHLSTCRSPMQMFGALLRAWEQEHPDPQGRRLVSVAIMPCTAKKDEIKRPESHTDGVQDVDYVLTSEELVGMIRAYGLDLREVECDTPDMPFGMSSGSGVIFGVTGGVAESVLRNLMDGQSRPELNAVRDSGVRGRDGIKEVSFTYKGRGISAAVVSGLRNAETVLQEIRSGKRHYDLVEFMACPGGCIMGGGQPVHLETAVFAGRSACLYATDLNQQIKSSKANPLIQSLYAGFLQGRTHKLLHRNKE